MDNMSLGMKIKTLEVAGFHSALHAMRNPMDSWAKSDTKTGKIGPADKDLSQRLSKAGEEHAKHLRMIQVWVDIKAPRYWWQEFDTYRMGVEKISCSTMHTLMRRPLTMDDFEMDADDGQTVTAINLINLNMDLWKQTEDPDEKKWIWRGIIQSLPQSFLQKRTVMMNYAAIRRIYHQREGHKLVEWERFRAWARTLPESWMITGEGE